MDRKVLYDKIYACWLGKNIGGTLGTPVEGKKEVMNLTWYPKIDENGALPNDDLDLQLVGLHALEQYGVHLTAREIAQEWTEHVYFPWDEYGYAGTAMRYGFLPPFAGIFDNSFTDCMGSPIRSEIWAGVCAGNPQLAAYFAWQDAVVDHAGGEGVFGEIFNAALEAAAYTNQNLDEIIPMALSYLPETSRVRKAVTRMLELYREGKELLEAREILLAEYGRYNFTDAPQNIAFELTGLLWGKDFEDAILKVVNLGYDTDCTVATCGALWGILHGTAGIPAKWSKPIGDAIAVSDAVRGFRAPANLAELTEKTLLFRDKILLENPADYVITEEDNTDFYVQRYVLPQGGNPAHSLNVALRYKGSMNDLEFTFKNNTDWQWNMLLSAENACEECAGEVPMTLKPGESGVYTVSVNAPDRINHLNLHVKRLNCGSFWTTYEIPFTVLAPNIWLLNGKPTPFDGMTISFPEKSADGVYTAETILHVPATRETLVFINTTDAATMELDGKTVVDSPAGTPFLPAYHRSPLNQRYLGMVSEGDHTVKVTIKAENPPMFVFGVNASWQVPEPGNFFSFIDVTMDLNMKF